MARGYTLKIGDRVQVANTEVLSDKYRVGDTGIVVESGSWGCPLVKMYDNGTQQGISNTFELTTHPPITFSGTDKSLVMPWMKTLKRETPKMGVVNRFKQSTLNPDERLLRKYNLRDECGWTQDALDVLEQMLLDERREDIVKFAKELQAEDKKVK